MESVTVDSDPLITTCSLPDAPIKLALENQTKL